MNDTISLRSLVIMFVNLRQTIVKVVFLMIDRVIEWNFNKLVFWKYLLHFKSDEFIHTIVIINMQKPTSQKIITQVIGFVWTKGHVTVPCHMNKRIVKELWASYFNNIFFRR